MDCRVWLGSNPPGNPAKVDIAERCGSASAPAGRRHASCAGAGEVSAPAIHVRGDLGGTDRIVADQLAASAPIG
jgi:hypothetical protein